MSSPLRILHVTRDFPPRNNGGLGSAVGGLVQAQARSGILCSVVSFDDFRPIAKGGNAQQRSECKTTTSGVRIIRIRSADAVHRALEFGAASNADVVHVHDGLLWQFAWDVAKALRAPTVLSVHVLQSEQNRLRGVETTGSSRAQAKALAECSIVHAPSRVVAAILVASDASLADRLQMVRLGTRDWPNAANAFARNRFTGDPMLLYVGRFADINGFGQLIDSLPKILAARPELRVTIAGGMPDNPKSEKRWKKRWNEVGGHDAARVHWAGWLQPSELSDLYGKATALVVPSWFETFGQVVLEGMLHGTPLITTAAGALPELADERCAVIIEAKSSSAIAEGALALLADPAAANERRVRAHARVATGYRWDDRVEDFRAIYRASLESY